MYIVILLTVISSLSVMFLSFQFEKEKTSDRKTIKLIHIYIASFLMGAIGAIFAMIGFNFEIKNKKLVIFEITLAIIQVVIIILYYIYF